MSTEVHQLLGDLVVASVELVDDRVDLERWLVLAHTTAIAARERPGDIDADLVATLASVLDRAVVMRLYRRFEDTLARLSWPQACVFRSGLEAIRDLLALDALDMAKIEGAMLDSPRYAPVEAPAGTPAHHWWWFASSPAGERTVRMNRRMQNLLPTFVVPPSARFRELVAGGFVTVDGCLFLGARAPTLVAPKIDDTTFECVHNELAIETYLDPDPSRRPVDLAAATLACARHLAAELRRRPIPPCRIIITVRTRTGTLRFHQLRASQAWLAPDLERYEDAVLALET